MSRDPVRPSLIPTPEFRTLKRWQIAGILAALMPIPGSYMPLCFGALLILNPMEDVGEGSRPFWLGVLAVYWLVAFGVIYMVLWVGGKVVAWVKRRRGRPVRREPDLK